MFSAHIPLLTIFSFLRNIIDCPFLADSSSVLLTCPIPDDFGHGNITVEIDFGNETMKTCTFDSPDNVCSVFVREPSLLHNQEVFCEVKYHDGLDSKAMRMELQLNFNNDKTSPSVIFLCSGTNGISENILMAFQNKSFAAERSLDPFSLLDSVSTYGWTKGFRVNLTEEEWRLIKNEELHVSCSNEDQKDSYGTSCSLLYENVTGVVCIGRCWAAAPKTNESCLQTTTSISKPSLGFKPQGNITFYAIGLLIFCYLNYL